MTALARASRNCKRQTRPLVRESAPHQQTLKFLTVIKICSEAQTGALFPRQTGRLTLGRNIRLRLSQAVSHETNVLQGISSCAQEFFAALHQYPQSPGRKRNELVAVTDYELR
jgi:uncharacterized protein YbbK (DUF523 family)